MTLLWIVYGVTMTQCNVNGMALLCHAITMAFLWHARSVWRCSSCSHRVLSGGPTRRHLLVLPWWHSLVLAHSSLLAPPGASTCKRVEIH